MKKNSGCEICVTGCATRGQKDLVIEYWLLGIRYFLGLEILFQEYCYQKCQKWEFFQHFFPDLLFCLMKVLFNGFD